MEAMKKQRGCNGQWIEASFVENSNCIRTNICREIGGTLPLETEALGTSRLSGRIH